MTAYDFIHKSNGDKLDSYAINFYGNRITYEELFKKISEAELAFIKMGIEKGDFVTFCMPTLPETVYSFYALNKIGAVCNFIDLRMNKERILKYINDTNSKLVVSFNGVSEKVYSILKDSAATKLIDVDVTESLTGVKKILYNLKVKNRFQCDKNDTLPWKDLIKEGKQLDRREMNKHAFLHYNPEVPAAIVYTGGTTGEPKGAILSNNSLNISAIQYGLADIPRGYNDRFLDIMPPFIAYGLVNGIHFPISLGMEDVLVPKFTPEDFSQLLKKYRTPHFVGIPLHFEKLMHDKKCENLDLSFIKNAGCGGDTIPELLETEFNEFLAKHNCTQKMRTGYGMTENAAMSILDLNNTVSKVGKLGVPLQKMNIGVFDENGNELGYNEVGELRISSPSIIDGYFNNEEETNKAIITINNERWIKTGDIVSIDEDGFVKIIGRKKDMIIRPDGHNVWPDLIRNNLFSCPIIKDVCVIGVKSKHNKIGEIPTAVVVLKDPQMNQDEARQQIFEYQSHLLGERDGVSEIRFRNELPLTPIGKIDVMKLTEEENKNLSNVDFKELTNNKDKKKVLKI
ncbi:MAG: acyl--CoA ligase [Bacilli bacterium]|nr:acyl--CoA ligase [Bacilli bacterium]